MSNDPMKSANYLIHSRQFAEDAKRVEYRVEIAPNAFAVADNSTFEQDGLPSVIGALATDELLVEIVLSTEALVGLRDMINDYIQSREKET